MPTERENSNLVHNPLLNKINVHLLTWQILQKLHFKK